VAALVQGTVEDRPDEALVKFEFANVKGRQTKIIYTPNDDLVFEVTSKRDRVEVRKLSLSTTRQGSARKERQKNATTAHLKGM
jgi:hypothetical protein